MEVFIVPVVLASVRMIEVLLLSALNTQLVIASTVLLVLRKVASALGTCFQNRQLSSVNNELPAAIAVEAAK